MKVVHTKYGVSITDAWFEEGDNQKYKGDILRLHGIINSGGYQNKYTKKQFSLLTNLSDPEEYLFSGINKNYRYEIRRSEKDEISISFYQSLDILNNLDILSDFKCCYDRMFHDKGMDINLSIKVMQKYAESNALLLSVVRYQGEPIVFHSYVVDGKNARFFHSCSKFREEKGLSQLIGRANKRLHWEDLLFLKKHRYQSYDWGGLFSNDASNGIDAFKLAFGGQRIEYYNVELPISVLGRIAMFLKTHKEHDKEETKNEFKGS